MQSKGRTALLDAMYLALNEMKKAKNTRKAILVISDGGDNNSRYTFREVRNRVREADVQIYAIGILEPMTGRMRSPEEFAGPALLDDLAHQSGGRLFEVDDLNELPDIAAEGRHRAAAPVRAGLFAGRAEARRKVSHRQGDGREAEGSARAANVLPHGLLLALSVVPRK